MHPAARLMHSFKNLLVFMRLISIHLLKFTFAAFCCALGCDGASAQETSLRDYLQIGSRVSRGASVDTLEIRMIISPEIRLYGDQKTGFQSLSVKPVSVSIPHATPFRMIDGSVHQVYSGSITLSANYPKGALRCGSVVKAIVNTQGCTSALCFPPEQIPVSANTEAC